MAEMLPNFSSEICKLSMQAAMLFIAQKQILVTLPFCAIVFYFVQKIYLRTSSPFAILASKSKQVKGSYCVEEQGGMQA
jgi:hypothetical protein